jgi:hypothetical protein
MTDSAPRTPIEDRPDDVLLLGAAQIAGELVRRISAYAARDTPDTYRQAEAALKSGIATAQIRIDVDGTAAVGLWLIDASGDPLALVGQFSARAAKSN